jgi:hypothetical protein
MMRFGNYPCAGGTGPLQAVSSLDESTLQQGLRQLVEAELLYQRGSATLLPNTCGRGRAGQRGGSHVVEIQSQVTGRFPRAPLNWAR